MKYNYWLWTSELSDEVIDGIIERCKTYPAEESLVGPAGEGVVEPDVRRSKLRWITEDDREIRNNVWKYATSANANAFGFDIIDKFDIQFTTYHDLDKGCYHWHTDNDFKGEGYYDRKLSVIIQLTDPSEYDGGKFEFEINGEIISPEGFEKKGSIIVFPSFTRHRVTEVTKGTRNSLVSWVQGTHFR